MSPAEIWLVVAGVLAVLVWLTWSRAHRLDRLHRKVTATRATLDSQLVRRAAVAAELAGSGRLDPVTSLLLADGAFEALGIDAWEEDEGGHRAEIESGLTAILRTTLDDPDEVAALSADPVGSTLLDALTQSWYRVQLARRFHNESVAQAERVRRKLIVRALRIAGHAPMPQTIEIDDSWPSALPRPGSVT